MLNTLSLKSRLWLLGLISASGIAILAIASIWHAQHSKAVLLSFVDEKIALSRTATESYAHGLQMGQALRNILLDPDNRKAYDNLADAGKSFGEESDKLVLLIAKTPDSGKITKQLKSDIEQWLPLQTQILNLVNEKKNSEAMSLLVASETPAWRAVKKDILEAVKSSEEAAARSRIELLDGLDSSRNFSVVLGLVSFLMVTVVAIFVARGIFKLVGGEPAYAAAALQRIASGDLTQQVAVRPGDNASIVAAMRDMQSQIHRLIGQSVASADSVVHESEGLRDDAAGLSKSAQDQSSAVSAIAAAVEQLTVSIGVMSENADKAGELTSLSEKQASDGMNVVSATTTTIGNVAERMTQASITMEELAQKVNSVSGIVQTIRDIADQTNLLALNAAIEAARAGEQGRGFAVVADEVRKLAELTTKSTQKISQIVEGISQTTDAAVSAMQQVKELALDGATRTADVHKAVKLMDQSALDVGKAVSYIVNALREQTAASNDIAQRIESIAQGIEQTHAASSESSRRSDVLVNLSHALKESVRHFKV
ncbi:MAG: methyl-accepting chemotaxis protein [Nitrosomonadales bacterium]|nr:methyl-accepting chemotaxis protein [Nitrosomonadales bacterium]